MDDETRLLSVAATLARESTRREPSLDAICAVCIAGEVRSLAFEPQQQRLYSTVVEPLRGDAFLVLSPHTSRVRDHGMCGGPRQAPCVASSAAQASATSLFAFTPPEARGRLVRALRPVAAVFAGDGAFWAGGLAERNATYAARFSHVKGFDAAVRFRVALMLVERAESARGARYPLVVKARPDVYVPCTMRLPRTGTAAAAAVALWRPAPFFATGNDFIAVMDRATADVALRHMPLASGVGYCRDPKARVEWCLRCTVNQQRPATRHYLLQKIHAANAGPTNSFDLVTQCQLWSAENWLAPDEIGAARESGACKCKTPKCWCRRPAPRTCENHSLTLRTSDARTCEALDELQESEDSKPPLVRITPKGFLSGCHEPARRWREENRTM